ncbi:hypothetical protein ACN47E_007507 [Coniothyrium glycines]
MRRMRTETRAKGTEGQDSAFRTEVLARTPTGHASQASHTAIADLETSHFALSDNIEYEFSGSYSNIAIEDQAIVRPDSQQQPASRSLRLSNSTRKFVQQREFSHKKSYSQYDQSRHLTPSAACRDDPIHPAQHKRTTSCSDAKSGDVLLRLAEPGHGRSAYGNASDDTTAGDGGSHHEFDEIKSDDRDEILHRAFVERYRSYTARLGVPKLLSPALSTTPSIEQVSDAGEQDQLNRGLNVIQRTNSPEYDAILERTITSLPVLRKHELQQKIHDAREHTYNGAGHPAKFIPGKKLRSVLNLEAVTLELAKELPDTTLDQIKEFARKICTDLETSEMRGKLPRIRSYRKIFALLVLVEAVSSVKDFLNDVTGISDQDLPLTLDRTTKTMFCRRRESSQSLQCFEHQVWSPTKLENFQEFQWQLLIPYFAPMKDGMVKNYILQDEHVLPFLPLQSKASAVEKQGGHGKVLMVQIHPDHHSFPDPHLCEQGFAIKQQIYDDDRDAFKKEADILRKFSGERSHPHVVSLLATYEQYKKIHLVFHRADGDLFDYWKKLKPSPTFNYANINWTAAQCLDLRWVDIEASDFVSSNERFTRLEDKFPILVHCTDLICIDTDKTAATVDVLDSKTLSRQFILPLERRAETDSSLLSNGVISRAASPVQVHHQCDLPLRQSHIFHGNKEASRKQYGRHGDINPGNILWFNNSTGQSDDSKGVLKIADFGQAEVNSYLSKTKHRFVANTLTYRPPECDANPQKPALIRQTYDIWCLGCVYLEFATWLLGGQKKLRQFAIARSTLDELQYGQKTDTFFEGKRDEDTRRRIFRLKPVVVKSIDDLHEHKNCSDFLHDFLLLIQQDMLVISSQDRKSCKEICHKLSELVEKCRQDNDYATTANPWCIKTGGHPQFEEIEADVDGDDKEQNCSRSPSVLSPTNKVPSASDGPTEIGWFRSLRDRFS